ncbi:DUF2939 domain-containing protein [Methylobacterium nigriterrae]|uniref:DUF2939 domain-containing protein n=1 Tax=Methylobacterium nigriterrae TaxID=3127512 RepID=UPI003013F5F0
MRWWSIPILLALGWFAFTLTPFWALYDLARAVEARDVDYVDRHVNFRTLRLSLVRQTTAAARDAISGDPNLEPRERQTLNDAATALALALAETMVTAKTVVDLLDDGWPETLDVPRPASATPATGLHIGSLSRLVPYYLHSEMRGFRTVVIAVPPEAPRSRQLRIRLRMRGWVWRLVDIEVTEELRAEMAQKLARTLAKARAGERR